MVHTEHEHPRDPQVMKAIDDIIQDLSDRRGIGSEWDAIDLDIKNEIIHLWHDSIRLSCDPTFDENIAIDSAIRWRDFVDKSLDPESG